MSFYGKPRVPQCTFQKYDKIRVIAGRKVPIGTEGEVFWISTPYQYGQGRFPTVTYKIGIKDAQGLVHWTYDKNIKLLERNGTAGIVEIALHYPTPSLFEGSN